MIKAIFVPILIALVLFFAGYIPYILICKEIERRRINREIELKKTAIIDEPIDTDLSDEEQEVIDEHNKRKKRDDYLRIKILKILFVVNAGITFLSLLTLIIFKNKLYPDTFKIYFYSVLAMPIIGLYIIPSIRSRNRKE